MSDDGDGLEGATGLPNYIRTKPMTDPTADAAKLLPCCDFCNKQQTELGALLFGPPLNGNARKQHVCVKCYQILVAAHNSCPQPAAQAGEPDFEKLILTFESTVYTASVADATDVPATRCEALWKTVDGWRAKVMNAYRLGLAARPKVEDAGLQLAVDYWEMRVRAEAAEAKLAEREAELAKVRRNVEQLEEAHETLTNQQSGFLRDRDLQEAAIDLVGLWRAQKISGASRAERNATIEHVRERLIRACESHAARQQQKASAEKNESYG